MRKLFSILSRQLNNVLPWRPKIPRGARLSWRARIKGAARNIHIAPGACVSEDVILQVIDSGASIKIGRGTFISPFAKIVSAGGGCVQVGENCTIHSFDVLYGFSGGLIIEDGVRIGVNAMFISGNHRIDDPELGPNEQGSTSEGIRIGTGSWIGAGAIILDGVTLAPKSVVGAGAVVTKSFKDRSIVVGVPARPMRQSRTS